MFKDRLKTAVKRSARTTVETIKDPVHLAERWGVYDALPLALARSRGAMRLARAAVAKELAPVAPTPMTPVLTLGAATLYRYAASEDAPPGEAPLGTNGARDDVKTPKFNGAGLPVLLCPSLINRPYILDLTDGNSLVQALHAAGRVVYTIDWGDPGDAEYALDFSDFTRGRLRAFIDETCEHANAPAVHMVGHCLGGTMATALVAVDDDKVASLANLTAPIDFDDGGMLAHISTMPFFDARVFAEAIGHIPSHLTQPVFQFLRPLGMHTKVMRLFQNLGDERFLEFYRALETWVNDNVSIPRSFFVDLIERFYRDNALVSGTFVLAGDRVDLANVKIPVLTMCAQKDNIVPPHSAQAGHDAYGSVDKEIEVFGGGHIGVVVGGAAKRRLWPRLITWFAEHDDSGHQTRATSAEAAAARAHA